MSLQQSEKTEALREYNKREHNKRQRTATAEAVKRFWLKISGPATQGLKNAQTKHKNGQTKHALSPLLFMYTSFYKCLSTIIICNTLESAIYN